MSKYDFGPTYRYADLIKGIHAATEVKYDTIRIVLDALFDSIKTLTKEGNVVNIPALGKFERHYRGAGVSMNPFTGGKMKRQPCYFLAFKAIRSVRNDFKAMEAVQPPKKEPRYLKNAKKDISNISGAEYVKKNLKKKEKSDK